MQKVNVISDHTDIYYWSNCSKYMNFVREGSDIKMYTLHPETIDTDDVSVKCAMIIEPRCFGCVKPVVDYVGENYEKFDYIFTHDDELLKLPNARLFHWGGAWCPPMNRVKTKNLSIISSHLTGLPMYEERLKLARYVKSTGIGDAYGTFDGGVRVDTTTAHADYRFAIAVENHIEDWWWTEKINNCFTCKTVPIYIGARKIGKIFDADGIIQCNSADEVIELLKYFDFETEYEKRRKAIDFNYVVAQRYTNAFDNLYLTNLDVFQEV